MRQAARTRLLLAVAAVIVGMGSGAMAADLPMAVKAAPPVVAPADWSGFYIGIHGGGGWSRTPINILDTVGAGGGGPGIPVFISSDSNGSGGLVGGHAGYNWQYYHSVVAGLELDASFTDIKSSETFTGTTALGTATEALSGTIKSLASARARLGWLPTNWLMIYGTGGVAWERLDQTSNISATFTGGGGFFTNSTVVVDRYGFVAGVGAEAMILGSANWLGRIEYLHYDFGDFGSTSSSGGGFSTTGNQTVDVVRGGVTFKFGP